MKLATIENLTEVAKLLKAMYFELDSLSYKEEAIFWKELAMLHLTRDTVLINEAGLFIMRDETLPVHKEKVWNGVSVYIKPEYRHTRVLKDFYTYMFDNFKGKILGFTEVNSPHNKVLLKRHKLIGYVYVLNRCY